MSLSPEAERLVKELVKQIRADEDGLTEEQRYAREEIFLNGLVSRPLEMIRTGVLTSKAAPVIDSLTGRLLDPKVFSKTEGGVIDRLTHVLTTNSDATHVLLNSIGYRHFVAHAESMANAVDPASKMKELQSGYVGQFMGRTVITDAFLHPKLRFASYTFAVYSCPRNL